MASSSSTIGITSSIHFLSLGKSNVLFESPTLLSNAIACAVGVLLVIFNLYCLLAFFAMTDPSVVGGVSFVLS